MPKLDEMRAELDRLETKLANQAEAEATAKVDAIIDQVYALLRSHVDDVDLPTRLAAAEGRGDYREPKRDPLADLAESPPSHYGVRQCLEAVRGALATAILPDVHRAILANHLRRARQMEAIEQGRVYDSEED